MQTPTAPVAPDEPRVSSSPAQPPLGSVLDLETLLEGATGPLSSLVAAWLASLAIIGLIEPRLLLLNVIGFVGAFAAGLVGIGGAILLTPLLLYVPPAFGLTAIDMYTITGITMVQVAVAGVIAMLVHWREGYVDVPLVKVLGTSLVISSFAGAALSGWVSVDLLKAIFASLATLAVVLLPLRMRATESRERPWARRRTGMAALMAAVLGVLVGMVGAGGGFLLVPILLFVLHLPLRNALGTSLAIVALSAVAGAIGKLVAGHVDGILALALVAGALPGAQLGANVSHRLRPAVLSILLALLVGVVAARMWLDLLG